ncbi:FMN-dependent dehydrogenase-domain-containing protein [Lentinula detonsa]|uniref:L-lactate dehydrogenase (cytochrome) n=1 Tax=Lentinula detonsa TaxID=2804962 RepID=A0A9W8P7M1_9AGAR|nr:FMN-dependent dehydrogenase-domain-containing protein [Lentinula detonsa]
MCKWDEKARNDRRKGGNQFRVPLRFLIIYPRPFFLSLHLSTMLSGREVAQHNSRESCWIIVHGKVYDVTEFLNDHPGGSRIILKYAGKDATQEYDPIHPPDAITSNLPPEKHLGPVQPDTVEKVEIRITDEEKERLERIERRPSLSEILNLHDFESIAKAVMPVKAWAYYSSAADDEITIRENHAAYHRIWFRPRILRDVTNVDFSSTILGHRTSMPIYITATALGKLGHPDGELILTRAAAQHGVIQMIPTLASCSFDELVDGARPGQVQFFQLYVNKDRGITKRIVQHAESRGIKGLFITVDAPQLGRREKDMRQKFEAEDPAEVSKAGKDLVDRSQGAARAISSFIDPGLNWADLQWFKSITKMPLILKGVQCWEDALEAYDQGMAGVVLSNHGGRQLDFSRSGVEILAECVEHLKEKRGLSFPNEKFQLFVDGGVRRATDVLKAVALGATAVGIGRPFLYAYSAYGPEGVDRALQILHVRGRFTSHQRYQPVSYHLISFSFMHFQDEFEMNMRLLGAPTIKDVLPEMVDASNLRSHIVAVPSDSLFNTNYEVMQHALLKVPAKAKI